MPFSKGHDIPGGRKKGSENKKRSELREALAAIIEEKLPDFLESLEDLKEENVAKYLDVYLRLLEYSIPKLRSVDTTIDVGEDSISKITVEVKKKD